MCFSSSFSSSSFSMMSFFKYQYSNHLQWLSFLYFTQERKCGPSFPIQFDFFRKYKNELKNLDWWVRLKFSQMTDFLFKSKLIRFYYYLSIKSQSLRFHLLNLSSIYFKSPRIQVPEISSNKQQFFQIEW